VAYFTLLDPSKYRRFHSELLVLPVALGMRVIAKGDKIWFTEPL